MELFYCPFCIGTVLILNKGTALAKKRMNKKEMNKHNDKEMNGEVHIESVNEGKCRVNT